MAKKEGMLTTSEVAEMLNRKPKTIRKYAKQLNAVKMGRDLLFDPIDVEKFKAQLRVVK